MVRQRRNLARTKRCGLCLSNTIVDYKDTVLLRKYISERGKILGRARTRICAKHQRQLTKSIKRARIMALLPFVQS